MRKEANEKGSEQQIRNDRKLKLKKQKKPTKQPAKQRPDNNNRNKKPPPNSRTNNAIISPSIQLHDEVVVCPVLVYVLDLDDARVFLHQMHKNRLVNQLIGILVDSVNAFDCHLVFALLVRRILHH
jgi:hypothetical protein